MRAIMFVIACLVVGVAADAMAKTTSFVVTRKTEHKIGEIYGVGGLKFCVWAYRLGTKEASPVSVRRSHNGSSKFLYKIRGKHCWRSKLGAYIVYAAADKVDLKVFFELPAYRGDDTYPIIRRPMPN
ncbi:hypothetical protein [Rhizobium leguminosarum]|uniref:hypothetical protein n=1 Tax=Rhizobium leguminosarum TaxID=384 RepID=UPI003F9CEA28